MQTISNTDWDLVNGAGKGTEIIATMGAIGSGIGVSGAISNAGGLGMLSTLGSSVAGPALAGIGGAAYAGWSVGSYIGHNTWVRGHLSDFMTDLF